MEDPKMIKIHANCRPQEKKEYTREYKWTPCCQEKQDTMELLCYSITFSNEQRKLSCLKAWNVFFVVPYGVRSSALYGGVNEFREGNK